MQESKKKIKVTVEKTETGFSAFCNDYPVFTIGRTVPELVDNALEAVNFYFEVEGYYRLKYSLTSLQRSACYEALVFYHIACKNKKTAAIF